MDHALARQQRAWNIQAQFDAIAEASRPQPVVIDPLAILGGAVLTASALALILFFFLALPGGGHA